MIKYCEADNTGISKVIVHKLDRFSRNKYDSTRYKHKLKINGIRVFSVLEKFDGSPESVIMESLLEGMSEYYSLNLAREVMKRKNQWAHKATAFYLITGLIKCECGATKQSNRRLDQYKNEYVLYRCSCRKQKQDCTNKEIKKDYLEEFVLTELEKHVLNDEAIPVLSGKLNERLKTKSNNNHEMLNNLRNKLEKVNKEIENIFNAIMSGIVNSMLKDKLDELEQAIVWKQ